jgi:hypothetical protein
VVNAFRAGLDTRVPANVSNPALAAVLQKQASLSKRLSQASSIEYVDNCLGEELPVPEIDVEKLSSHSHTETAV